LLPNDGAGGTSTGSEDTEKCKKPKATQCEQATKKIRGEKCFFHYILLAVAQTAQSI
jgi:hypothetical protein